MASKTSQYSEKLKDPRWQKKRLEVFERDEWSCRRCCDTNSTLAVHHLYYIPNKEPWDYPEALLITLCEECHNYERENCDDLMSIAKSKHFLSDDRQAIAEGILKLKMTRDPSVMASIICWLLGNDALMEEIEEKYFNFIDEKFGKGKE